MCFEDKIISTITEYATGSNFELLGTYGTIHDENGLTFECYDYLDKGKDFETDVNNILNEIIYQLGNEHEEAYDLESEQKIYEETLDTYELIEYTIKTVKK